MWNAGIFLKFKLKYISQRLLFIRNYYFFIQCNWPLKKKKQKNPENTQEQTGLKKKTFVL